jgi:BON domain
MYYTRLELRFRGQGFRRGVLLEGAIAGQALAAVVHAPAWQVTHTVVTSRRAAALPGYGSHQLGSGRTELPPDYVRVSSKTPVLAGKSVAGRLSRLWCDRHSGLLTYVLLQQEAGLLRRSSERVVAAELLGPLRASGLELKLSRADLSQLPLFVPDEKILADIQLAFESALPDPRARREVKMRVEDGHVTLAGSVDGAELLDRARRMASAVVGVRGLTVDLVVQEALASQVEASVGRALAERAIQGARVRAYTEHGIVYLEGRVTAPELRDALEGAALAVPGVLVVVNNLSVEGEPPSRASETGPLTRNR